MPDVLWEKGLFFFMFLAFLKRPTEIIIKYIIVREKNFLKKVQVNRI